MHRCPTAAGLGLNAVQGSPVVRVLQCVLTIRAAQAACCASQHHVMYVLPSG